MKEFDVVLGIVVRDGEVLICRRRAEDPFGDCWEFPGGKREGDETAEECLRRELNEELAVLVSLTQPLPIIQHTYPDARVRLIPFICSVESGELRPIASQQMKWVMPAELRAYRFPDANAMLVEEIIRTLGGES